MTRAFLTRSARRILALAAATMLSAAAAAPDLYDAAVTHPGRSDADRQRDPIDHPAELLRLAGLKPGMQIGDLLAAGGYYSELASYVVGPSGHVLLLNNRPIDYLSESTWQKRLAGDRLPNVEHRTIDLEHLALPDASLDAMLVIKVYHDFYWVDDRPNSPWPRMDPQRVLSEISRVIRPGGIVLLVDHLAKVGMGRDEAVRLHRIAQSNARHDFELHGFEYIATTDVLHHADDDRSLASNQPPILGHTSRFVMVFHKR